MENIVLTADIQAMTIQLNTQNAELYKRNTELENTVAELSAMVRHFQELFKLSQQHRFGASSEKIHADQVSLSGAPETEDPKVTVPERETITYKRRKKIGKRQEDLSKLPLEVVEHELTEEERECPKCGDTAKEIGIEKRSEIKIVPARVIHVEHRSKVYKCGNCDKNSDVTPIIKATAPEPIIKGSAASASAIACIMSQKYLMHLPLYRLEQDFKRQGAFINRQNMANWVIKVCTDWLYLIYDRLRVKLLEHEVIHSDDTGVQVLREPGKEPQDKSNMWLYRTSGDSKTPVALYEYQPNRNGEHLEKFLKGWAGYIMNFVRDTCRRAFRISQP